MQQQIAQFFFDAFPVFFGNRICQFIGFFDRQLPKGLDGLLFIPGTFFPRSSIIDTSFKNDSLILLLIRYLLKLKNRKKEKEHK